MVALLPDDDFLVGFGHELVEEGTMVAVDVAEGESERPKASLRPHLGDVSLHWDPQEQQWALVHSITLEVCPLPNVEHHAGAFSEYELAFDEDGFGAVANDEGWGAAVEELFSKTVYEDDKKQLYFSYKDHDGAEIVESQYEHELRFVYCKVEVLLAGGESRMTFAVAKFDGCRPDGSVLVFDMLAAYRALGLRAQKGQAWKWVNGLVPTWERLQAGGLGVVQKGAQLGLEDETQRDATRNIANLSLTTPLFLAALSRMLNASKARGGIDDEPARYTIRCLLHRLACMVGVAGLLLPLWLDHAAKMPKFPISAAGSHPGKLVVSVAGNCWLQDASAVPVESVAFFRSLGLLDGEEVPLVDLLVSVADARSGKRRIHEHLMTSFGRAVELALLRGLSCDHAIMKADEDGPARCLDTRLEQALVKHQLASQKATAASPLFLSMGVDKSRVGTWGLQVCAGVLPSNEGFLPPPCVVPDLIPETDMIEATRQGDSFQVVAAAVEEEIRARQEREGAFLSRKRKQPGQAGKDAQWRPSKRHRKDAWQWGVWLDHQIREGTCHVGLKPFEQPLLLEDRKRWNMWPLLSISPDQGSPEVACMNYLQRAKNLNLDDAYDFGHGCHRDLCLALKRSDCWEHALLKIAEWNVPHGPWCEDVRHKEVHITWITIFTRYKRPQDSPLFMFVLPWMIWEAGDKISVLDDEVALKYWNLCMHLDPFEKKGPKTNLNRFLSYLGKGIVEAPLHSIRLFGYLSCCLEQDYLGNSKLTKLICKKGSKDEGGVGKSTGASGKGDMDSALAKAAVNQLAVGTMVLLDRQAQVLERGLQKIGAPLKDWYAEYSKAARSVSKSAAWVVAQLQGGFVATLNDMLKPLQTPASLAWIGIGLPRAKAKPQDINPEAIHQDDETVQKLACFWLSLAGCRLVRCAYLMSGFSFRSALWTSADDNLVKEELRRFKQAYEDDDACREHFDKPGVQALHEASQFRQVPVQQLVCACQEEHFEKVSKDLIVFLHNKHRRLITSEVIENAFNRQKRMKAKDYNRRLELRRAWKVLLDKKLMSEVNEFDEVKFDGVVATRGKRLSPNIQEPS